MATFVKFQINCIINVDQIAEIRSARVSTGHANGEHVVTQIIMSGCDRRMIEVEMTTSEVLDKLLSSEKFVI